MKRVLTMLLAVLLLIGMLPTGALGEAKYTVYISSTGSGTLKLRAGPGTDYGVNGYVYHGDKVTKLDESGIWSRVKTGSGAKGWIKTKYIDGTTRELGTGYKYVKTSGSALNLRSGPGTGYASRGSVANGSKVKVLNTEAQWVRVTVSATGKTGWILGKYISDTKPSGGGSSGGSSGGSTPVDSQKVYHVSSASLNVRTGPGADYAYKTTLYRGKAFRATAQSGNWFKIKTFGGVTGWVSKTYVASGATATVTAGSLNMRSAPGTGSSVIKTLGYGAKVNVVSVVDNWAKVTSGGKTGYVSLNYLRL